MAPDTVSEQTIHCLAAQVLQGLGLGDAGCLAAKSQSRSLICLGDLIGAARQDGADQLLPD